MKAYFSGDRGQLCIEAENEIEMGALRMWHHLNISGQTMYCEIVDCDYLASLRIVGVTDPEDEQE